MNTFEWIVLSLLTAYGVIITAVLFIMVRVLDRLNDVIELFSEEQTPERLQSVDEQENLALNQPVTLVDILMGRKDKKKLDPNNVGKFRGRQPWA